ncbi:polysaccharide pyruvyl transferase family protein [Adhaeretor mobilis]|uniref:Colanic acid biosynthesis protein n=1 Tax=Adhaeretor mobilis TaxID=1930276 RepID=A0A517N0P4_9BACT|nr:polysaccharide pyruvyl transferase family protein [Adhaeretor mobilis]QDT00684.1 colanic acid biosynthesis protein [Adhaeretor mobilis]
MIVQLFGAGFDNRGAQLMLWTAAQKLRELHPEVEIVVEAIRSSPSERASYDLRTLFPSLGLPKQKRAVRLASTYDRLSRLLPTKLHRKYGLVRRCDVDAFIDISGYAFGDKWTLLNLRELDARLSVFARKGKPRILLPQMLGPFNEEPKRRAAEKAFSKADLIYARDQTSLECVQALDCGPAEIQLAPDITIFCDAKKTKPPLDGPYASLVPNARMLDKAAGTWGENYMEALVQAGQKIKSYDVQPIVVIHDIGQNDIKLGYELADRLEIPRERVYQPDDALEIKQLLAQGVMTIGSRFHALVSSLSTGVPSIALGWAHKYEALLKDFGLPELCCHHTEGPDCTLKHIDRCMDPDRREQVVQTLQASKKHMRAENERMWSRVSEMLRVRCS